jgi:regulator of cell morphogenesis and NO signaling
MEIRYETRVADIATEYPATVRVFQKYGIDFCCGGKRPVGQVCGEKKVGLAQLRRELDVAAAGAELNVVSWHTWSIAQVVNGIIERYHRPLDEELPRLSQMMRKVLAVHGDRHKELAEVSATFGAIRNELRLHMLKEEEMLFPYVVSIEAASLGGGTPGDARTAPIGGSVAAMEEEHQAIGQRLAALRELTGGYRPPADACNTFRGLYHGLEALEHSVHEHVHVENNILFPRAARVQETLLEEARVRW